MVLAVVGTMKAGKSTTINAIVGQEILPKPLAARQALTRSEAVLQKSLDITEEADLALRNA
ncbi:TPA: dynamin family protein, partial [Escherichia coli]|nr:dynamin family protein [Escherichia coli]